MGGGQAGWHARAAAAALAGGSSSSPKGSPGGQRQGGGAAAGANGSLINPSASMLEDALQQCLAAVEAGELEQGDMIGVLAAPPTTETFDRGSGSTTTSNLAAAGGGAGSKMASSVRVALAGGKQRPAAPGKKDDDRGSSDDDGGAAPAVVDGPLPAGQVSAATLRRRGWTWQLGGAGGGGAAEGGDRGDSSWVLEGGGVAGNMVHYVGRTGRMVGQAAGRLLSGGGAMMFNACTPPSLPPHAKGGRGARTSVGWLAELPGSPFGRHDSGGVGAGEGAALLRPGSRGAGAADGGGGDEGDEGSSQDPDLEGAEGLEGDEEGDAHELDQPVVRESISAVVATVVTADTDAGARAAQAEASAAEELLLETAGGEGHSGGGSGDGGGGSGGSRHAGADAASLTALNQAAAAGIGSRPPRQPAAGRRGSTGRAQRTQGPGAAGGQAAAEAAQGEQEEEEEGEEEEEEGAAASKSEDPRMVRRQMFPAGRILHLMPAHVVRTAHGGEEPGDRAPQQPRRRPSTAGAAGAGVSHTDYTLLEVPRREVYGRLRLCRAMVRDHFLPGYIRGLDAVAARLEAQLAADSDER